MHEQAYTNLQLVCHMSVCKTVRKSILYAVCWKTTNNKDSKVTWLLEIANSLNKIQNSYEKIYKKIVKYRMNCRITMRQRVTQKKHVKDVYL